VAALAVASVALALGVRELMRPEPAAVCDCPAAAASSDRDVNQALRGLEARMAAHEKQHRDEQASDADDAGDAPGSDRPQYDADASPSGATKHSGHVKVRERYTSFSVSTRGVTVRQGDDGTIWVETTDPGLVGKTVQVVAVKPDGTIDQIPVTISE
jgi:hypothetical protein